MMEYYSAAGSNVGLLVLFSASMLICLLATRWLIVWFTRHKILAVPDRRSAHQAPVAVGGGWVVVVLTCLAWVFFKWPLSNTVDIVILSGMITLAMLSWRDDRNILPIYIRLIAQIAAIVAALYFLPAHNLVFGDYLPFWADRLIAGICWLWFINLYNFMDGIDGLCGVETIHICAGLGLVTAFAGIAGDGLPLLSVMAGATTGFLWWNWHRAKIFMGDIGSITLGFILGWLLLQLAIAGYLAAALIIPLYYLVDATFTLVKRGLGGQKIWHAHKEHSYQHAARNAGNHAKIVVRIVILNVVLTGLALWSIFQPLAAVAIALAITVAVNYLLPKGFEGSN